MGIDGTDGGYAHRQRDLFLKINILNVEWMTMIRIIMISIADCGQTFKRNETMVALYIYVTRNGYNKKKGEKMVKVEQRSY